MATTRRFIARALLALLLGAASAAGASAQAGARLQGVVRDDVGLVLPGVTVEVEGTARAATTDGAGRYALPGLTPGRCQVLFRAPGFGTARRAAVLQDGEPAMLDAVLRVSLTADVLVTSTRTFRNLTDWTRRPVRPGRGRLGGRGGRAPDRGPPRLPGGRGLRVGARGTDQPGQRRGQGYPLESRTVRVSLGATF